VDEEMLPEQVAEMLVVEDKKNLSIKFLNGSLYLVFFT
jgi:hypothetical protein